MGSLRILMTADAVGGVWTYALELAAALAEYEVEIALAVMGPPPSLAQRTQVAALRHVQLLTGPYRLEWMEEPWADVEAAGDWLLMAAEEFQPDVVHLNGYVHAALPWKAPVLVVAHSCVLSWWNAVKGGPAPERWREYASRVTAGLEAADLILAPTEAMLAALRDEYVFTTPACVIANARSAERFTPADKIPVILSAGRRWDEAKNTALLERIAPALLWPVRLAGPAALPGETVCEEAPGVTHLGELSAEDLAWQLAQAAIYAAPARYEPFGLGILEAALAGCALVLSDLPSLRENWEGAALFVGLDDAAWQAALNGLIADDPARLRLGAVARERALTFSPRRMAAEYRQAYGELVQQGARSNLEPALP